MAIIRLVPSTYYVSNSNTLLVNDPSNMYANTDSTTYGTFTHDTRSTTTVLYAYLRGFNFNAIPSDATVNSFTVKIKAKAQGHTTSTSSSYNMTLANGTIQIGSTNADGRLSETITTFTFSDGSLTWQQIVGYGTNFGVRIPLCRAKKNTQDIVSVYGVEIEVNCTIPSQVNVSTKEGNTWKQASAVWKKISGNWVKQTDAQNIFTDQVYIKTDGTLFIRKN